MRQSKIEAAIEQVFPTVDLDEVAPYDAQGPVVAKGSNSPTKRVTSPAISLRNAVKVLLANNPGEVDKIAWALVKKMQEGNLKAIELGGDWVDGKLVTRNMSVATNLSHEQLQAVLSGEVTLEDLDME